MKLAKVHITNFRSIQDSNEFHIGDITCLVGKNEAGKTALLKALYRLNPIIASEANFDPVDDYPRSHVTEYQDAVDAGRQRPADAVRATFKFEPDDIVAVRREFGPECLSDEFPVVTLSKGYSNRRIFSDLRINENATIRHLVETANLPQQLTADLLEKETKAMLQTLEAAEQIESVQKLTPTIKEMSNLGISHVVYNRIIDARIPKFLYFDEYYQMKGQDNIEALQQRVAQDALEESDHPLLGLIELARLDLGQLTDLRRTETLLAKLEAAENQLTQRVLTHWSQNRHLRMKFDIRPAQPEDPEGMRNGTNILGRLHDTKHMVSTPLGSRSRGFIWFFSFLAWYSQIRRRNENIILLLDEPGLSLHGKAQEDLLQYFDDELAPYHQVIYTTHSVFMVDPSRFDRVRIVQDRSQEKDDLDELLQGTKVITEVLEATPDSLFPLQGALGYEIYQTLFVGPNSLVVEGVSDLLYIQTMSALLQATGRTGLSEHWTVTPVGGSGNVPTFVALIGARTNMKIAVLVDYQKKDRQVVENLYKRKLLQKSHVLTYADFIQNNEADIEDMFNPRFYVQLVNSEFGSAIKFTDLPKGHPRILDRLERRLTKHPLPNGARFNHYRPARFFSENIGSLSNDLSPAELDRFQQAFDTLNALL